MEIKKRYITPSLIRETIEDTILLSTSPIGRLKVTKRVKPGVINPDEATDDDYENIIDINNWPSVESSDDVEAD